MAAYITTFSRVSNGTEYLQTLATAASSQILANQPDGASTQYIVFGVLTILIAIGTLIVAYRQYVYTRAQVREPASDVEMIDPRKFTLRPTVSFYSTNTSTGHPLPQPSTPQDENDSNVSVAVDSEDRPPANAPSVLSKTLLCSSKPATCLRS